MFWAQSTTEDYIRAMAERGAGQQKEMEQGSGGWVGSGREVGRGDGTRSRQKGRGGQQEKIEGWR